jgi:sulfite exporter TauE/SafE/copper chaperone CopZ
MADTQDQTENPGPHVLEVGIRGMHCTNCAVVIERKLRNLPQVQSVHVNYPKGSAQIHYLGELDVGELQKAVGDEEYTLFAWADDGRVPDRAIRNTARDYVEIGAVFMVLAALVLLLQHFQLLPRGFSVSDTMSYGLVFVIGLVASVSSCIAVTGGLLVAVAAKYNAANSDLTATQRLKPHIAFNSGRIISYTLLGGAVGALGSALTLSPAVSGVLTLVASTVMILLGLQMLKLLPSLSGLVPTLPKAFAHHIHDFAQRDTQGAAFLLGGTTFFLPCGFTQALQLYVLAKGDFVTGALTMLAFALGTLPALLSLSALSSFAEGVIQKYFLRIAGAAVIMLGFMNIQYGLVLTGSEMAPASAAIVTPTKQAGQAIVETAAVEPQRISMKVVDFDYLPNKFTVKQGVPVEWWIDGSEAAGCGRVLVAPRLGIQKFLSRDSTTLIKFTPDKPGEYAFNCGMGMMTPNSKIIVLPNNKG